jgi:hypothetical protein
MTVEWTPEGKAWLRTVGAPGFVRPKEFVEEETYLREAAPLGEWIKHRLREHPEAEVVAQLDGMEARVGQVIKDHRLGYVLSFHSKVAPRVLWERVGAMDVGELRDVHEQLRVAHPNLVVEREVGYQRGPRGELLVVNRIVGKPRLPEDVWRWDPHLIASELLKRKPVSIWFRRGVRISELPWRLRLTPAPRYGQ